MIAIATTAPAGGSTVSDPWPSWATERIEVDEWDPDWEQRARGLISDLADRLAPWLAGAVEHVGSTAVPGLPAKPVIDLMAPVRSLTDAEAADGVLAEAGWHLVPPELDRRPWRRMHVLPRCGRRSAHLHLVEPGHRRWRDTIVFRDQLRQRRDIAQEYARLKRATAQAHRGDREAYTDAKSTFVESVVRTSRGV